MTEEEITELLKQKLRKFLEDDKTFNEVKSTLDFEGVTKDDLINDALIMKQIVCYNNARRTAFLSTLICGLCSDINDLDNLLSTIRAFYLLRHKN